MTARTEPPAQNEPVPDQARYLQVTGHVQAVGFRPFVYRLAHSHGLTGWVRNARGTVEILIQGTPAAVARFSQALIDQAPPLARPTLEHHEPRPADPALAEFTIATSASSAEAHIHVPPDYFACESCLAELHDPKARRYRYPFINCTQCGPRYTLIDAMPYDRANTTMRDFALCADCRSEYADPLDRRFHAEPLACPACGPTLSFAAAGTEEITGNEASLQACLAALRAGAIVAVRGIGGYHLICDAANAAAVDRLRERKHRPHKPLAVMVPAAGDDGLAAVRALAQIDTVEARQLADPARPIVLVERRPAAALAPGVAPGLTEVGVMLPYSPLHHLLLEAFGGPLVATSGNVSGEPVLTEVSEAQQRLQDVADAFVHHDRPIRRPADDPVYRNVAGRTRPLRLGRGTAPMELTLPTPVQRPTLAVGAFLKNTVALAWGTRAVVSPHIGDLGTPRGDTVFEQVVADLQHLYGIEAEAVVCDAHPDYSNTRWARRGPRPVTAVHHHHAHAAALAGEFGITNAMLVFTWDGTGFGPDGTVWGGEALVGRPGDWRRAGSLRPFRLPGGDRAGREPWRAALALCWEVDAEWPQCPHDTDLLRHAWRRRVNAPTCTAAGRVFDAAAALAGVLDTASFEGQGPMWLEAACVAPADPLILPLERDADGVWRTDWQPLLGVMMDTRRTLAERAAVFHASLARALAEQAERVRVSHGISVVGLTGGVFQNRVLAELAMAQLVEAGFEVLIPQRLPTNDAAISFGQLVETAARSP